MRLIILAAALVLLSGVASAEQSCTTRADGTFNCNTTVAQTSVATTVGGSSRRVFEPDETGLLRVPTQNGEILFHCDNLGPCKQIGLNPPVVNRQ